MAGTLDEQINVGSRWAVNTRVQLCVLSAVNRDNLNSKQSAPGGCPRGPPLPRPATHRLLSFSRCTAGMSLLVPHTPGPSLDWGDAGHPADPDGRPLGCPQDSSTRSPARCMLLSPAPSGKETRCRETWAELTGPEGSPTLPTLCSIWLLKLLLSPGRRSGNRAPCTRPASQDMG